MEDFSLRLQSLISKLRSHGVTIDEEKAVSKYLHSVPAKYRELLGVKSSAKEAWEAIAAMRVGSDRTKKATAQLLM